MVRNEKNRCDSRIDRGEKGLCAAGGWVWHVMGKRIMVTLEREQTTYVGGSIVRDRGKICPANEKGRKKGWGDSSMSEKGVLRLIESKSKEKTEISKMAEGSRI